MQLFTKNPGSLRDGIGLMVETSHLRVIGLFWGKISWLWFGFEFFKKTRRVDRMKIRGDSHGR